MQNISKYLLLLLPLILLFLSSCSDFDKNAAFNKIKEKISLSAEQTRLARPIFDEQTDAIIKIIEAEKEKESPGKPSSSGYRPSFQGSQPDFGSNEVPSREAGTNPFLARFKVINDSANEKLSYILSAEQLEQYSKILDDEIMAVMAKNRPEKGPEMGGPGNSFSRPSGPPPR